MEIGHILVFALFAVLVVVVVTYNAVAARKRRDAMLALAERLGLSFNSAPDHSLAQRFGFLDSLAQGSNRYAFNVLSGRCRDQSIVAFDYHYETHSTDSKGRRQTHHHFLSVFTLALPLRFPELRIYREGFFSKIGQFLGFDDIDFESAEFSKKFCARSKNKKFAYDFCHARMMEHLLANPDLSVEVETDCLAIVFRSRLDPAQIEANIERLIQLRALMPNYLFTQEPT